MTGKPSKTALAPCCRTKSHQGRKGQERHTYASSHGTSQVREFVSLVLSSTACSPALDLESSKNDIFLPRWSTDVKASLSLVVGQ